MPAPYFFFDGEDGEIRMLELFLGQIPEAIFFALFMIFAKGLKEKRLLFTILMVIEYLLLLYSFPYNWLFHICFMVTTFIILKVLYKEKSQITDVFLLLIGYIILGITSIISWLLFNFNMSLVAIFNRIIIFTFIFILNKKLYKIQNIYKFLWNRNDRIKKKIKSTTFRALNIVVFNISFVLINLCMLYAIYYNSL